MNAFSRRLDLTCKFFCAGVAVMGLLSIPGCRKDDDLESSKTSQVVLGVGSHSLGVSQGQPEAKVALLDSKSIKKDSNQGEEFVNVDFSEKTDVRDIIRAYEQIWGRKTEIDPNVSMKVVFKAPSELMKKDEALKFLMDSFKKNGISVSEEAEVVKFSMLSKGKGI